MRPQEVKIVDDVGVSVAISGGLRAARPMRVVRRQIGMSVLEHLRIVDRPEQQCPDHAGGGDHSERQRRSREAGGRAEPASERIADQPAGV